MENSGSFAKLWVLDAQQYQGLSLLPNTINNVLIMESGFSSTEIPFTLDSGEYSEEDKEEKPGSITTAIIKLRMPLTPENTILFSNLPAQRIIVIKDYENRYKLFGNINEPMLMTYQVDNPSDFNKGSFYQIQFSRKLVRKPVFITDPFTVESGSGH